MVAGLIVCGLDWPWDALAEDLRERLHSLFRNPARWAAILASGPPICAKETFKIAHFCKLQPGNGAVWPHFCTPFSTVRLCAASCPPRLQRPIATVSRHLILSRTLRNPPSATERI